MVVPFCISTSNVWEGSYCSTSSLSAFGVENVLDFGHSNRCVVVSYCYFNLHFPKIPWRIKWQPPPVFLLGKSHRQRSLMVYCPWGLKGVGYSLATKQQQWQITWSILCSLVICIYPLVGNLLRSFTYFFNQIIHFLIVEF